MNTRLLLLALSILPTIGCAAWQDFSYKNRHRLMAFTGSVVSPDTSLWNKDLRDGWRQGYYDLSMGIRCKAPTLPPHQYWKTRFQTADGQRAIADWYRGYELGQIAAERECGGCWHQVRPRLEGGPMLDHASFSAPPAIGEQATPVFDAPAATDVPPLVPQNEVVPPQNLESPLPSLSVPPVPAVAPPAPKAVAPTPKAEPAPLKTKPVPAKPKASVPAKVETPKTPPKPKAAAPKAAPKPVEPKAAPSQAAIPLPSLPKKAEPSAPTNELFADPIF